MRPLIIFDCDGVLVDTEGQANAVMAEYFTGLGYAVTANDCRKRFQGTSLSHVSETVGAELGIRLSVDDLRATVYAGLESGIRAIEGVETLIRDLSDAGFDICVASSGTRLKMRTTLGQTALLDLLGHVLFSAADVSRAKPHPDIFIHAARQMGYASSDAIVIEDSLPGVLAGRASGARVLGYCGDPFTDADALRAAGAETFTAMSDVPSMIDRAQSASNR